MNTLQLLKYIVGRHNCIKLVTKTNEYAILHASMLIVRRVVQLGH